jgi:hypothetical protein
MTSPNKKAFPLRIDPTLWGEIERLAAQELRSANAQVEFMLREGLAKRGRLPAKQVLSSAEPTPAPANPEANS